MPRLLGLWVVGAAALTVAVATAPLWASGSSLAQASHLAFRGLCHQDPARSFVVDGHAMAICHRCTGIDTGLLLGAILGVLGLRVRPTLLAPWAITAGAMGAQVGLGWALPSSFDLAPLRVATGLLLGGWMGVALVNALRPRPAAVEKPGETG